MMCIPNKLVMGSGSKNFDPGWVEPGQPYMVVTWIWKISPKNANFLPFGSKKNLFRLGQKVLGSKAGRPLIYCGSGRVRAHLYANANGLSNLLLTDKARYLEKIRLPIFDCECRAKVVPISNKLFYPPSAKQGKS